MHPFLFYVMIGESIEFRTFVDNPGTFPQSFKSLHRYPVAQRHFALVFFVGNVCIQSLVHSCSLDDIYAI